MNYNNYTFLDIILICVGTFAELVAFVFYSKYQLKFNRLVGTGSMSEIEIANNWKRFYKILLIILPVVFYYLIHSSNACYQ